MTWWFLASDGSEIQARSELGPFLYIVRTQTPNPPPPPIHESSPIIRPSMIRKLFFLLEKSYPTLTCKAICASDKFFLIQIYVISFKIRL